MRGDGSAGVGAKDAVQWRRSRHTMVGGSTAAAGGVMLTRRSRLTRSLYNHGVQEHRGSSAECSGLRLAWSRE